MIDCTRRLRLMQVPNLALGYTIYNEQTERNLRILSSEYTADSFLVRLMSTNSRLSWLLNETMRLIQRKYAHYTAHKSILQLQKFMLEAGESSDAYRATGPLKI